MRRSLRSMLAVIAFVMAVLSSTAAFAAPATWERVDVTLHSEQPGGVLLVSGILPEATTLPAEAELSVPAGSELQWIGEILGGPPAEDPALEYTKTSAKGVDVYRFTLTKSRNAQVEIPTTAAQAFDGSKYTSDLKWASAQNVPEVRLSLRVPAGSTPAQPVAGAVMQPGASGYDYYTKTVKNVKAGDKLDLAMSYTAPAAAAAAASTTPVATNSDSTVLGLFVLVIIVALIAVIAFRRKTSAVSEEDEVEPVRSSGKKAPQNTAPAAAAPAVEGGMTGATKRKLVTAGVVAVLVIGVVIVGSQGTKPKMTGDSITEVFAQGESCVTATIPLTVPAGADPATTAKSLFTVLRTMSNTATYNAKTSSVEVGFCESKSSEVALRAALAPTGLVAGAAGTAAP